jgi:LemA protein
MIMVENYPELKANENFKSLQEELTSTENKISFARQLYNDTVERYNTMIVTIPSSIIAGMCGFHPEEFFKVESDEERRNVKVEF